MGLAFTVDSPFKIAHYGIDSVISISDDELLEKMRKMYSELFEIPYNEITKKIDDYRAKRITSYLNLINELVEDKFKKFKNDTLEKTDEIKKYFNMLPDTSSIKKEFKILTDKYFNLDEIKSWLKENLSVGSIDVNIMTKLDKEYYRDGEKLPVEYNDAHAAFRGFANSDLKSSIVLSAGMNPRLYGYITKFEDFYPDESGNINKKITLKVSDYRSALIQGKFLAKKGIWISEYRIESGLNCGGHAFASDGYLMGPILEEFKSHRKEFTRTIFEILKNSLQSQNRIVPKTILPIKISAQGGVGTAEEHNFLLDHYEVDSVGWGSPFMLVPEATTVDKDTREKLMAAKEEDIYLSDISPLGVPFNSLRTDTKEKEKQELIAKGRPGSPCPKQHLLFNTEYTDKPICTASRQYQRLKIKELEQKDLPEKEFKKQYDKITAKACLCVGLGTTALVNYDIERKVEGDAVLVCPGPNTAYFSKEISLHEMTDHIYGRTNIIDRKDRPNMFIKELFLYLDYLKNKIDEAKNDFTVKQEKYFVKFIKNLREGIDYYRKLFSSVPASYIKKKDEIHTALKDSDITLDNIEKEINELLMKDSIIV
jgi:hypothetical protein